MAAFPGHCGVPSDRLEPAHQTSINLKKPGRLKACGAAALDSRVALAPAGGGLGDKRDPAAAESGGWRPTGGDRQRTTAGARSLLVVETPPADDRHPRLRAREILRWLVRSVPATRRRLASQDLLLLGAGLTFYAGIAVIPMLLIAVFLAGAVLGHAQVRDLSQMLAGFAPAGLGFSARLVELAQAAAGLSPLAVIAALIPATSYGEGLTRAFDRLADVDTSSKGLRGRLKSVALLGALPLLTMGAFGVVAVLPAMLGEGLGRQVLGGYLTFVAAWIGGTLLLAVTYRAFSPVPLTTDGWLWSSAGTGSFLAGMSMGWVAVLEVGVDVGQAYGGSQELGAGVLFAVYLLLVQLTCLVGYAWALELSDSSGSNGDA